MEFDKDLCNYHLNNDIDFLLNKTFYSWFLEDRSNSRAQFRMCRSLVTSWGTTCTHSNTRYAPE